MLLIPAVAAAFLLAACGDDSGSSSGGDAGGDAPAATSGDVAQPGYGIPADVTEAAAGDAATEPGTIVAKSVAYNPTEITVKVGDTVTFKNQDSFAHTFTADNGEFDSENVDGGGSFTFTPDAAGTIAFHCKIHSNMKGTITVES